jgi:hypothetical protein
MSKARTLADFISDGSEFADGTISVAEVSGAAPLASPTFTGNVDLGDNVQIRLGDDNDLRIYHDVSTGNSYIWEQGTGGELWVLGTDIRFANTNFSSNYARFVDGGEVELFHGNQIKLSTAADGVDITGDVGATTATITGTVTAGQYDSTEALPTVRPSLLLDFANSKTLDPRITFTRGSTATYWDGKTTTKAEENLLPYSTSFFGWSFAAGVTTTSTTETAPDGTSTAITVRSSNAGNSGVYRQIDVPIGSTVSFYAKYSNSDWVAFSSAAPNNNVWAYFDVTNGAVGFSSNCTASIQSVGNGWYRCILANIQDTNDYYIISIENSNTNSNPWGTSSPTIGTEITLWGPQLEQRSSVTAYTPTNSSPIVKYQPTLQTSASGEARFDHDPVTGESKGLLIEESRTNQVTYSEGFNASAWNPSGTLNTRYPNYGVAPDGGGDALMLSPSQSAGSVEHRVRFILSATSSNPVTMSCYMKAAGLRYGAFRAQINGYWHQIVFDLEQGVTGSAGIAPADPDYPLNDVTSYSIKDVGNGWYRCVATYPNITNTDSCQIHVMDQDMTDAAWQSEASQYGFGILIWGTQVEAGSFPTSYIPTSGSTVTRAADYAAMSSSEIGYYGGDFTVYSASTVARDNTVGGPTPVLIGSRLASSTTPQGGNYHYQYYRANGASGSTIYLDNTIYADTNPTGTITANQELRIATAYSKDDFATSGNGGTVLTDASVPDLYGINSIHFGNGAQLLNGHLSKVAFWNERLTNATLQAMTEA